MATHNTPPQSLMPPQDAADHFWSAAQAAREGAAVGAMWPALEPASQDEDLSLAHQATRHTRRSYWGQGLASRCRCHRCSTRLSVRAHPQSPPSRCCWRCVTGTCRWPRCSRGGWGSSCSRLSSVRTCPRCAFCFSRARRSARRRKTRCCARRVSLRSKRLRPMAARLCSGLPRCLRVPTQGRPRSRSQARSLARCSRTAPMPRG